MMRHLSVRHLLAAMLRIAAPRLLDARRTFLPRGRYPWNNNNNITRGCRERERSFLFFLGEGPQEKRKELPVNRKPAGNIIIIVPRVSTRRAPLAAHCHTGRPSILPPGVVWVPYHPLPSTVPRVPRVPGVPRRPYQPGHTYVGAAAAAQRPLPGLRRPFPSRVGYSSKRACALAFEYLRSI